MGRKDVDRKEAGDTRRCLREARDSRRLGEGGPFGVNGWLSSRLTGAPNTVRQDIKLSIHPSHP